MGIISFNFDCLLVEDFKRQTYVDYGVGFDFNNNRPSYRGGNPFRLVKPNGSLDWGICRTCDKLHLLPFNLRRTDYPLESCCADCDGPLYPYIVVPHEEYEGRINQVWQDAEALLRGADEVIVIGYSFPPYDRRVRALFGSTVSADCRITAIDYREDPEDEGERRSIEARIAEVFPLMQHQPKILLNGFHQFVDELG